jgi:hypothetical protein
MKQRMYTYRRVIFPSYDLYSHAREPYITYILLHRKGTMTSYQVQVVVYGGTRQRANEKDLSFFFPCFTHLMGDCHTRSIIVYRFRASGFNRL